MFCYSDLALRNCLLTSEMSVKIGDYGLSHSRYKVRPSFDNISVLNDCFLPCCHINTKSVSVYLFWVVVLKDDYYVTQDQIWVPLRWIAPELIDEVHGNLLVVDQTKSSNIW